MKNFISFEKEKTITLKDAVTEVTVKAKLNIEKALNGKSKELFFDNTEDINKVLNNSGLESFFYQDYKYLVMTCKGKATCSDKDEYDRVIGICIADTRAQRKIFKAVSMVYQMLQDKLTNMYRFIDEGYVAALDTLYTISDHERDLTGLYPDEDEY